MAKTLIERLREMAEQADVWADQSFDLGELDNSEDNRIIATLLREAADALAAAERELAMERASHAACVIAEVAAMIRELENTPIEYDLALRLSAWLKRNAARGAGEKSGK